MLNLPTVFPQITVRALQREKVQPGLTLFNLQNRLQKTPILVVILDPEGNVRWWYRRGDVPDLRGDIDVRALPEGVLIGGTNRLEKAPVVGPVLVSWKREILWEGRVVNHHHIHRTPEGNYVFLTEEKRFFRRLGTSVFGDVIVEYNPEADSVTWEWHLFDHLSPRVKCADWSHCNTVETDPRDDSLYLSVRNLNAVLKIDRGTGEIIWTLGENGDFEMAPEEAFYHQHSPEIQSNGNLLLFDNGACRPDRLGGEYSRAVEYALDERSMKARVVWSWRNHPDLFTPIWGDADRLENGNTLMVFGNRVPLGCNLTTFSGHKLPTQGSRIIEVTSTGEKVWDIELSPPQWGIYRAERVAEKPEFYESIDDMAGGIMGMMPVEQ